MIKPRSIVVVLPFPITDVVRKVAKWLPIADESTPYVVRDVPNYADGSGVLFEEGIIGINSNNGKEIGLRQKYVREIQPPEMGYMLLAEVEEAQLEAV